MKRTLQTIRYIRCSLIAAVLVVSGCAIFPSSAQMPGVRGRVTAYDGRDSSVPGVDVVYFYNVHMGYGHSACGDIGITVTDGNGNFEIPARKVEMASGTPPNGPMMMVFKKDYTVHKVLTGRELTEKDISIRFVMRLDDHRSKLERINKLARDGVNVAGCMAWGNDETTKEVYRSMRRVYYEALEIGGQGERYDYSAEKGGEAANSLMGVFRLRLVRMLIALHPEWDRRQERQYSSEEQFSLIRGNP